jgi:hypothetical protein
MLGLRREKREPSENSSEPLDVTELRHKVASLERVVRLLDADLQDAIDGFYRRRQADRMRDVREEDAVRKKRERPTERDILLRALQLSGDKKDDADDSHAKRD